MPERYFSETRLDADRVVLRGGEAHHLASVMRASVGDGVVLFDGTGIECEASVVRVARREVELQIESRREVIREASVHLTLAVAMPKSDRQKWLVEKAVELGVARIVPIATQRSVVKLKERGIERLRRAVIEASKQCGRNRLMAIESPVAWRDYIGVDSPNTTKWMAHPTGPRSTDCQVRISDAREARTGLETCSTIAIGPEGGFTEEEVQAAIKAGWQAVSLGPRILRIETAALKLASLILRD